MNQRWLLRVSAAIEGATGVGLVLVPYLVARLLLGASLSDAGFALARVAGLGFVSLAIACWPGKNPGDSRATRALFVYNLLAGLYLGYLRLGGGFTGLLLWPACILHLVLAVFFVRGVGLGLSRRAHDTQKAIADRRQP